MTHVTPDPFEQFESDMCALEVRIEEHRDHCKHLIETYVTPGATRTSLLIHADDRGFQALKGVHALADVADEVHSRARHLRVEDVAA